MASAFPFSEDLPFTEKVKCLADEELLEIWAESQRMENFLNAHFSASVELAPEYERAIINELALRAGRRIAGRP